MTADPHRTPLVALPAAWRYSLKQLLFAIAIIAVGCVALRNASSVWVAATFGSMLIVLAGAALCAAFRAGHSRAFWFGFAACGWLYVLVLMYGWSLAPEAGGNPLTTHRLATTRLSRWSHEKWFPTTTRQVATSSAFPQGRDVAMPSVTPPPGTSVVGYEFGLPVTTVHFRAGPQVADYVDVAHALWTLLFALCGGWFARWLYDTSPAGSIRRQQAEAEASRASSSATIQDQPTVARHASQHEVAP